MEKNNDPVITPQESQSGVKNSLLDVGNLPLIDLEFHKKETQKIIDLSPETFAQVFSSLCLMDLKRWEDEGYEIGRVKMNRKPKSKSINELAETIYKIGAQVMCIVVPARIATKEGYEVEYFDGKPIPEDKLDKVIIILDGQTRYFAYKQLREEYPDKDIPGLYAYFPLNWVELSELLQAINLKVFTWSNSDYMTGTLANKNITEEVRKVLEKIQSLEAKGYNYTAACEWMTLTKGIVRKNPLVKAMDSDNPKINFEFAEFAFPIYDAALSKFSAVNEDALKTKTFPEFIIEVWRKVCRDLSQKDATTLIVSFLSKLSDKEVKEIVSPSKYKRGCGKKKESFIVAQLKKSFGEFLKKNPYINFKSVG